MSLKLKDKVSVITGASSGIGRSIALVLATAGSSVCIAARRLPLLEELKAEILALDIAGVKVICVATDVSKAEDVQNMIDRATAELGDIDILVNNAGVMHFTLMKNVQVQHWNSQINVNIIGTSNCFASILPKFLAHPNKRGGHIVNITSDAGRRIFPALAHYCASKTFIEVLSEGTRRELVGTGVKITCIQPGDVAGTELLLANTDKEAAEKMGVQIGELVGVGLQRDQLLEAIDVANAVLFAVTAPEYVAVNEILIEPRDQM
jgi:NADP-dependent 3-hydroxy acid dehydrogenase YdfG